MLTYLWGDVLRIMAGHVTPGEIAGATPSQGMWLIIAALILIPIVMLVLTLMLNHPTIRWANIIVPILLVIFNLFGFSGYPGAYDKFLLVISFVFNVLIVWHAWKWVVLIY
jgi:hypothetical protein